MTTLLAGAALAGALGTVVSLLSWACAGGGTRRSPPR